MMRKWWEGDHTFRFLQNFFHHLVAPLSIAVATLWTAPLETIFRSTRFARWFFLRLSCLESLPVFLDSSCDIRTKIDLL